MTRLGGQSMCILVLAPVGRDAELTCVALREAGLECRPCSTMTELCEGIRAGCGAVLVAEEMFSHEPMETLEQELRNQPQWSDLPIVLLTRGNGSAIETSVVGKALDKLGNVLLLERPTRVGTLVSVCRSAIRARNRQYQILRHVTDIEEAERSLEHRTQELARSNAELQDFAYITSHDLKEPLRGISNYVQFLLEEEGTSLSEQGVERLLTIQRLTRRMYLLLDSLLEYSRAGRVDFALAMQSVETIVDEVLDTMGPWLEEKGAQVVVHRPLPTVLCDRVRVGQVFTNLIANAVKYNDNPVRRIEVGCERGPDGPIFYVRDNGIGIPPRHHETVFRMFRRLHARDQYGGGTGAGLPLVKRVVERHGGRIWIDSDMGKGATFYFTFGNPQAAPPARLLRMNGATAAADGRPHRDQANDHDAPPPRSGSPDTVLQSRTGPGAGS